MKKSVEKVCEMFVLEDHLLKLKQNWCAMQVSSMLQTWCTQVENLECGRFVLFQCKNKIARATEIPHIVCAYCLVSQGYSHSLFVVRLNIKLNKTRVCSCVSRLFQGQGKFVEPKKKSVAKKGTLNNFNSYLNTRPNQSWATMVETSSLNNTPLLLPKNYVCWYFFNSNTQVSLNEKTERTQRNTASTFGFQPGTYRVFHYKVKKNEEMFFFWILWDV